MENHVEIELVHQLYNDLDSPLLKKELLNSFK